MEVVEFRGEVEREVVATVVIHNLQRKECLLTENKCCNIFRFQEKPDQRLSE